MDTTDNRGAGEPVAYGFNSNATNILDFADEILENVVKALVMTGKAKRLEDPKKNWQIFYTRAVIKITNAYPLVFMDISSYSSELEWSRGLVFTTTFRNGKDNFIFSYTAFDEFAEGIIRSYDENSFTFPYLISTIYHEYIHVYQDFSLFGFDHKNYTDDDMANREIEAYYFQSNNRFLPRLDHQAKDVLFRKSMLYFNMLDQANQKSLDYLFKLFWQSRPH